MTIRPEMTAKRHPVAVPGPTCRGSSVISDSKAETTVDVDIGRLRLAANSSRLE